MRPRRFHAGDEWEAGGVHYRCVAGRKGPRDVRVEWRINGEWLPVILDALFAPFDCIAENEDDLYPYPARGGEEVLRYFKITRSSGWREAARLLHIARMNKANRLEACLYREDGS